MALIKCPECGKQISNAAISCPGCGFPIKKSYEPIYKETFFSGKVKITQLHPQYFYMLSLA